MMTGLDVAPLALPTCVSREEGVREAGWGVDGKEGGGRGARERVRERAQARGEIASAREREEEEERSLLERRTRSIALTTSLKPSNTHPKTVCLPSRCGVTSVVMKNCDPLVPGPALA